MDQVSTAISSNDCIQPFFFTGIPARGALVRLENSFVEALNGHGYPEAVNNLLGQSLAAVCLMSTHLKFSARLSLQARSLNASNSKDAIADTQNAAISLMLAEAEMTKYRSGSLRQRQSIRGLARLNEHHLGNAQADFTLANLLGRSQLAVMIEPESGERYQGIVDAQSNSLAESLEDYFIQSEQLATQLILFASKTQAVGLLIQEMPNHGGKSERHPIGFEDEEQSRCWEELLVLAQSLKASELFSLTAEDCLYRLFHQHEYRMAEPVPVQFACSCSQERTGKALENISMDALEPILLEEGEIVMDCEFCSSRYRFDRRAIQLLKAVGTREKLN